MPGLERPQSPYVGGEKEMLLEFQRATAIYKSREDLVAVVHIGFSPDVAALIFRRHRATSVSDAYLLMHRTY